MSTTRRSSRSSFTSIEQLFDYLDDLPSDGSDSEFDGYVDEVEALESSDEATDIHSPLAKRRRITTTPDDEVTLGIQVPEGSDDETAVIPAPPRRDAGSSPPPERVACRSAPPDQVASRPAPPRQVAGSSSIASPLTSTSPSSGKTNTPSTSTHAGIIQLSNNNKKNILFLFTGRPFTGTPGLKASMTGTAPIDFFDLFFNNEVKDLIHTETTRYADQRLTNNAAFLETHKHARGHDFRKHPMERNEVGPLLAMLLTMGVLGYPSIRYRHSH